MKSFVDTMADAICNQFPSAPVDTALAVVSAVATRQRLAAVKAFARGKEPLGISRSQQIINAVCSAYAVTSDELLCPRRLCRLTAPRRVAWVLMRRELRMSYMAIADAFGRTHTSIIHGVDHAHADAELLARAADISGRLRASWGTDAEAAE